MCYLHAYYEPGTILIILCVLSYLIIIITYGIGIMSILKIRKLTHTEDNPFLHEAT